MKPTATPLATAITATAGTLFALQHEAAASIIYTSSGATIHMAATGGSSAMFINLKNAGPVDFRVDLSASGPATNGRAVFTAVGANGMLLANSNVLKKVASGAAIGPAAAIWGGGPNAVFIAGNYVASLWASNKSGFAGVRLDAGGGNYQYGWIRLRVDNADPGDGVPDSLTVIDYAYETTDNTPIAAGAGIPTPEPGTAALLALAGGGAALLRRRREVAGNS